MNPNVKITIRFMKGKILMFAKTSIISFAYDMIDVFCFPEDNSKVQAIYNKHKKNVFVPKFKRHRQYIFIICLYLQFKLSIE